MDRENYPEYVVDFHKMLIKKCGFHESLASECTASSNKEEMAVITKFLKNYGRYVECK